MKHWMKKNHCPDCQCTQSSVTLACFILAFVLASPSDPANTMLAQNDTLLSKLRLHFLMDCTKPDSISIKICFPPLTGREWVWRWGVLIWLSQYTYSSLAVLYRRVGPCRTRWNARAYTNTCCLVRDEPLLFAFILFCISSFHYEWRFINVFVLLLILHFTSPPRSFIAKYYQLYLLLAVVVEIK